MASFFVPIRVRFSESGEGYQDKRYGRREERVATEKTASLKEGKKRISNWFQRPIPGQMSDIDHAADIEFAAAAAAAAYAVALLDDEESLNQKKTKIEDEDYAGKPTEYSRMTRWFSGKDQKEDEIQSGGQNLSAKAREPNLSMKKKSTLSDRFEENKSSKKREQEQSQTGLKTPSVLKPTDSISRNASRNTTYTDKNETKIDAWEKAKMEKIRTGYEKLKSSIEEWEAEKKSKAKRRLERKEGDLELRRARATREYRDEIMKIDKMAGTAKALAEERRRNDQMKTMGKAKKMRSAGTSPRRTCFGFLTYP